MTFCSIALFCCDTPAVLHYLPCGFGLPFFKKAIVQLGELPLRVVRNSYGLRIHARIRPGLRWDDHALTLSMLLAIAFYAVVVFGTLRTGVGRLEDLTIPIIQDGMLVGFISQLIWTWCATWIKMSVALMMLRLKQETYWRWSLLGLMIVLLFTLVGNTISILLVCQPIKANYDLMLRLKPGTCLSQQKILELLWSATVELAYTTTI